MTALEQAIKDAVDAGWMPRATRTQLSFQDIWHSHVEVVEDYHVLLDPAFWQALGKARGWADTQELYGTDWVDLWLLNWHRLIDHLASGKDVESFFASLV